MPQPESQNPFSWLAATLTAAGVMVAAVPAAAQTAESATELPAVTVYGVRDPGGLEPPYAGGQIARGGDLGILGSGDVLSTPFSTVNFTSQFLEDIQARTLADVITKDASVRTTTSAGGFGEDFQIRGFTISSLDTGVNGLYGLLPGNRVPTEILERVELLKGPGTLMRGIPPNGGIGGSVNVVTKRADDEPLTRLTTTYATQSNVSTHLDVGRRFGDDKAWGVRFNGVLRGGEGSIDGGKQDLGLGALALDYRGSRLRWSLDAIYSDDEVDDFRGQIGFRPDITAIPEAPDGRITFYPGTTLTQRDRTVMSRLEYDLNDHLTAYVAGGYRDNQIRQVFPVTSGGIDTDGDFSVQTTYYDSYTKTFSGEIGAKSRFSTGAIGHQVNLGLTRMRQESGSAYSPGTVFSPSNVYDPSPLPPAPSVRQDPTRSGETTLDSIALADTLSFVDDRVLLTLGMRRQSVRTDSFNQTTGALTQRYEASEWSPALGLVVKPTEHVSIYGNYTEGLTPGSIVGPLYANAGEILKPYRSKQYEMGVKVDWGALTTTAAVYQLTRPSAYADGDASLPDSQRNYGYFGEQRNRGLELSAYGEVSPGLRLIASAAFVQSRLTKTQNGVDQGNATPGVPSRTYNLGLDWDAPWVSGLSLNGRVSHTASTYISNANTLSLPSVTTVGLGARYRTRIGGKSVVIRADVDNLTDKRYWLVSTVRGAYATNAAGRTYLLSASVDF